MSSATVKEWRRNTKQKIIEAFGGQCAVCGYSKCNNALEFHHLDPTLKDTSWGRINGNIRSWDRIRAEMIKCVCLCANCHREVHAGLIELPDNIQRFDDSLVMSNKRRSEIKPIRVRISVFDSIDLEQEYRDTPNYEAIGRKIGVTGAAVKRRLLLLKD